MDDPQDPSGVPDGDDGEKLRGQYMKDHPWIVDWVDLDWEHFKNRYGQDEGRHIIENLRIGPQIVDEMNADRRKRNIESPKRLPGSASTTTGSSWIQRVRIQSPAVISHLAYASDAHEPDRLDRVHIFIYPFTLLMVLQPKMKAALERLEEKWAKIEPPAAATENGAVINGETQTEEDFVGLEDMGSHNGSTELYPYPGMDDQTCLEHLRCYVKFVDEKVLPLYNYFQDSSRKKVRFDEIATLFPPGEIICWPSAGSVMSVPYPLYQPAWRVYGTARSKQDEDGPDDIDLGSGTTFWVRCYYIDHDGNSYAPVETTIQIDGFYGEKSITDLPAYPFRYADDADRRLKELKHQGDIFRSFLKERHLYYDGWTIPEELNQRGKGDEEDEIYRRKSENNITRSSPEHIESPVVIDFAEAFERHPLWKVPSRIPSPADAPWERISDPYEIIHWKDKSRTERLYTTKDIVLVWDLGDLIRRNKWISADPCVTSAKSGGMTEVKDEDIILLPRRLVAYALRERKFLILDIFSLRSLVQHGDMFKDLKINLDHQQMVESLVKAHSERRKMQNERPLLTLNQDLVYGKGAGLFILLHGAPGVGKTATAEAVAQRYNKPLFSITCGNLGLTPREVEDELKEIFRLAHRWDCVLLLDEADVFLARRDIASLKRNALVSVFLRVLEYYSGILFLTTNRVGTIDEAFKSRIHLSLYYERLSRKQMLAIFRVNLRKLRDIETAKAKELLDTKLKEPELVIKDNKIMEFAKTHWETTPRHARWNGRQIRNAFQIASSMARYDTGKGYLTDEKSEQPVLDGSHFQRVAATIRAFDTYFELATGETDEQAAFLEKSRDDRLQGEDLASYMGPYETPSVAKKSSRATKAREAEPERPRKQKGSRKGKSRDYDEEEEEERPTKAKRKSSKSTSLQREVSSHRKTAKPSQSSRKPTVKNPTKPSAASRSSKKTRNDSYDDDDDDDDDSEATDDATGDSEATGSVEEGSSEDETEEEDSEVTESIRSRRYR
ncbi:hypothetical protein GQX73_g427 [Xylaria multiplex]|uniref:AAA+ ATPase domain-containing protein n=1 Tax=Xylaria multiplex TaxID=323545 RepID=A0A7C8MWQ2_9PEZI|nr:hypothetical protein GQX73_g427 [Xylaria multiplex]